MPPFVARLWFPFFYSPADRLVIASKRFFWPLFLKLILTPWMTTSCCVYRYVFQQSMRGAFDFIHALLMPAAFYSLFLRHEKTGLIVL